MTLSQTFLREGVAWSVSAVLLLLLLWRRKGRPVAAATAEHSAGPAESLTLKAPVFESALGRVEQIFWLTLDERGGVVLASADWHAFLARCELDPRLGQVNANFLELAADPAGLYGDNAIIVSRGVGAVVSRSTESIRLECRVATNKSTVVLTVAAFGITAPGQPNRTVVMHVPVIDRMRFQTLLEESETRYRHLFRLSPLPLLVADPVSMRILAANEAAGVFAGRSVKELEDELLSALIDAPSGQLERWMSAAEVCFEAGVRHASVGTLGVEVFSVDIRFEGSAARLLMIRNLTEQRAAEAATRSREAILRAVCEAGELLMEQPDWVSGLDRSRPCLIAAAQAEFLNVMKSSAAGDALEDYPAACDNGVGTLAEGVTFARGGRHLEELREGRVLSVSGGGLHLLLAPLFCSGSLWGAVALGRSGEGRTGDLGPFEPAFHDSLRTFAGMLGSAIERDEIQGALRQADEQLRHSQKMEAIGQLASGVSHDFNNLLTAIQGYITLAKGVLPEENPAAYSLEQLELAARQASGVASSLLAFSRRSAGERLLERLDTIAEPAVRLLRRSLPSSVSLEFRCGEPPAWVSCDPAQIQQVIVALALNAKDAMPEGGRLAIEIDQEERAEGARARVRVIDTGVGMPLEVQQRIFEPFFTTKQRGEGTGLSLAISHNIIELHEGDMKVQSEPMKGSTFTFTLPAAAAPAGERIRAPIPTRSGVALVVEDNQLVAALVSTILASMGYSPVQAGSVSEACECMNPAPTLIIVDLELPDIPGPAWVRSLRDRGVQTPVVFITGRSETHDLALSGSTVCLHKPFQAADLVRVVESMFAEPSGALSS